MQFDSLIDVRQWLKRIGHQGQVRVDQIVASIRTGGAPAAVDPEPTQRPARIAAALIEIAERLAAMNGISVEAGEELLKIDALARINESWDSKAAAL